MTPFVVILRSALCDEESRLGIGFSQDGERKWQFPLMGSSERHLPYLSGLEGSLIIAAVLIPLDILDQIR